MSSIDLSPRIARPDDFYQTLIDAHQGLSDDQSMKLNAKLVLILANQVRDPEILQEAVSLARQQFAKHDHKEQTQ